MSLEYERARLKKRYGWTGGKYNELSRRIVHENVKKISERVANQDKRRFQKNLKKLQPKRGEKKIVLPDVSNIVRRSPTLIKAADQGELMINTLRERLRIDIKQALLETGVSTTAGRVPARLAKNAEKKIRATFQNYVKKHPGAQMPANLKTIAVTETTAAANQIRREYVGKVAEQTPGYSVEKKWIQNAGLSVEPRPNHRKMRDKSIEFSQKFKLPGIKGGTHYVDGPHDPTLPKEEFINCHCELAFRFVRKK